MTTAILTGLGCFALGGVVGLFAGMMASAHMILNNVNGMRDKVEVMIAKAKGYDRAERFAQTILDELRAKKGATR